MRNHTKWPIILSVLLLACVAQAQPVTKDKPRIYVPYRDLAAVIDPAAKAVLMDRKAFGKLLAAAQANARAAAHIDLGQVTAASYSVTTKAESVEMVGELTAVSMSDKPVAVELGFARIALTGITLDGKPAPLGYDAKGKLVLIVTGKGPHKVKLAGSAPLKELRGGGMQFGITLPTAVAGTMKLQAPGDLEVHASVPLSPPRYDRKTDTTTVDLTLGGHGPLTVVLTGNGRQEDRSAILLGESAASVRLTKTHQLIDCVYTVQVLRRGVRELRFAVPADWTVTDVSAPNLVKWSVRSQPGKQTKELLVRLRSASRGTRALHVQATAPRRAAKLWRSGNVKLVGAAYERGFLLVDPGRELRVRGEKLRRARRQDAFAARALVGMLAAPGARLYHHWSDRWSVQLDLASVALRTSSDERQSLTVAPEQLTLEGRFQIAAIGRELFDISFELPAAKTGWKLDAVTVNGRRTGFEYRLAEVAGRRTLRLELARPVRPEGVANVFISMRKVPAGWDWHGEAPARTAAFELIRSTAETTAGLVAITSRGDLDASPLAVPAELKLVTVGRMASLGLGPDVQAAYTYKGPVAGQISLRVARRKERISAASVALITVRPTVLEGDWRITYTISRARTRTLYLLAAETLGRKLKIDSPGRRLAGKAIVAKGPAAVPKGYNLWKLTLDARAAGQVQIRVHYSRPLAGASVSAPLVRPFGADQSEEVVAVQASEELAVTVSAVGARAIDAVELPALPAPASRLLAAYRLEGPTTEAGAAAAVQLKTRRHAGYAIPAALVTSARLTTYLGAAGRQQTEARLQIVNAAVQFLTFELPEGAELWSVSVAGAQAKPKRSADGAYLISLPRSAGGVAVRIVYAWSPPGATTARVELGAVKLPRLKINQAQWRVFPPPGYRITSQQTRMATRDLARPTPAYAHAADAAAEVFTPRVVIMGAMDQVRELSKTELAEATYALRTDEEAVPAKKPAPRPEPKPEAPPARPVLGVTLVAGRQTLPVELAAAPGAGPPVSFTGFGPPELVIGMTSESSMFAWGMLGLFLVAAAGVVLLRHPPRLRWAYVLSALVGSTLLAIWRPGTTCFANGAFLAAVCLVPFYVLVAIVRWLARRLPLTRPSPRAAAAVVVAAVLAAAASAQAGAPVKSRQVAPPKPAPLIVPYEGDPTKADESDKVLVPYARYVRLWNLAHPDEPIELPVPAGGVSLAGVRYEAAVEGKRINVTLTARVRTLGKGWVVLPMPISGLAVTKATFADKPARLRVGPKGMVLMLPGGSAGQLRLEAVAAPKLLGRRGSIDLSLPPLPGAVMAVRLPADDLILEATGAEGVVSRGKGAEARRWLVPLGAARKVTLRWSPKVGVGAADRTLSAEATHEVYAFHWAVVGVSRIRFSFSAGKNDRFALLLPEGATLTALTGANVRDFRVTGRTVRDGRRFKVLQVRLHRPAERRCELTLRWLTDLPALEEAARLLLPRAANVGRESGSVTLHAAAGMTLKVTDVAGGRRASPAAGGRGVGKGPAAVGARTVGRYYWPYRPFAITVKLSRPPVTPVASLDQLVRVAADRAELLVNASLSTRRGRIFSASFALPDGYELLSVVGPAVGDFYEQPSPAGRRLHVNLRSGVAAARMALVLVRRDVELARFSVPTVTALDPAGKPLPRQTGRLAVQLEAALEAQTAAIENLKPIDPRRTADWLDRGQVRSVRFAYRYETPAVVLALKVRPLPTKVRVEVFGALTVQPTAAMYVYRLRYNISGSPIDRVSFSLPTAYARHVAVTSPSLRSVTTADAGAGRTRWDVALVNEVTGVLDVAVNFALPIDKSTAALEIPRLSTEAPAGYRGIVAVQNFSRHKLEVQTVERLTALPIGEQRKLLSDKLLRSLQCIYQSYTDDWAMSLKVVPAAPAKRIQAVVDLMAITTVIDRSGRCRYRVELDIQNRSEQFLRVNVPAELKLWSARVAGQAVRPVTAAGAPAGEVLIPLVKTSPGGLPYKVLMYFAGRTRTKLGSMTRLAPPRITLAGVPVMRTTWSLRLPGGYRYVWRGGNMSPVAGAAEMMTIRAEALIDQTRRQVKLLGATESTAVRRTALANLKYQQDRLERDTKSNMDFIDRNPDQLSEGEYQRLKAKASDQWAYQEKLGKAIAGFETAGGVDLRADLNWWLNNDAVNPGTAEQLRNATLNRAPRFVQSATEGQRKAIAGELKDAGRPARTSRLVVDRASLNKLLQPSEERSEELEEITKQLEKAQAGQVAAQRRQLKRQLDEFADSRLSRHYQQVPHEGKVRVLPATRPARPSGIGRTGARARPGADRRVRGPGEPGPAPAGEAMPTAGVGGYVAAGTFSLPVELPEGEVRLDFARPSGQAEVTIWAIRVSLIHKLCGTGIVLAAIVLLAAVIKLAQRLTRRATVPSTWRLIVYAVLLVAGTLLARGIGLAAGAGLIAAAVIILLLEMLRNASAGQAPSPQ